MGKVHTENVRRLGNVEVAAVVGSRPERAKQFAEAMGIPKAAANLKEVLDDKEIAAVHICTPNVDHCPMSKAAIEAGKAVLCEKPLTSAPLTSLMASSSLALEGFTEPP